jgi:hypothetical protein
LPFIVAHPAHIFFIKEKPVVISLPVNKTLRTAVIISPIRIMVHTKTWSGGDNK